MSGADRNTALEGHIRAFVDRGIQVENIRDIWYHIKHDIEYLEQFKPSGMDWGKDVNKRIGDTLWNMFLDGSTSVYDDLNILTKSLDNVGYVYNTPVVIFSEKVTRAVDNASEALLCAKYISEGQIPHFEVAKLAEYYADINTDDVHLFSIVDYDPAGESIFNSLCERLRKALVVLAPRVILHAHTVSYGDTYNDAIGVYDSYLLSTKPKNTLNKDWIGVGQTRGVELNVMHDKQEKLEDLILQELSPSVVAALSLERARVREISSQEIRDEKLQKLEQKIRKRKAKIEKRVFDMDHHFTNEWIPRLSFNNVREMTVLKQG